MSFQSRLRSLYNLCRNGVYTGPYYLYHYYPGEVRSNRSEALQNDVRGHVINRKPPSLRPGPATRARAHRNIPTFAPIPEVEEGGHGHVSQF